MPATIRGVANYIKFPRARCRGSGPGGCPGSSTTPSCQTEQSEISDSNPPPQTAGSLQRAAGSSLVEGSKSRRVAARKHEPRPSNVHHRRLHTEANEAIATQPGGQLAACSWQQAAG